MSEKKIDLIAQLLAKAEQTTPEEAEALTEHAERLMIKYMIDQATIDERRAKAGSASEKIITVQMDFTGGFRGEMLHLCAQVMYGLGSIRGLQNTNGHGRVFSFFLIGYESDVEQAKALIQSLQVQSMVAVRTWWKENKAAYSLIMSTYDQEKARRSFAHGFGTGAGNRIRGNRATAVQEAGTGTELVLVSRVEKVQEYTLRIASPKKSTFRMSTGRDEAAGHGYRAGQNASTGEKAMTQGRGISA